MTSIERMYALYTATRYVIDNEVPGHFVECGVWRGEVNHHGGTRLERGGQVQLVYKHAISTLQPAHALNLEAEAEPGEAEEGS